MGNNQAKRRQIKVTNILGRLSKQDKQNLKDAFDRIQDRQVINDYQFRIEVLGPQVPDSIGLKLMQLFSSEEAIPEVLNYEDLLACYVVFKHGRPEEIGQICFEIMKMNSPQEYLSREHITVFVEKLDELNEQQIQTFYAKTEFDPRLPIKKEEFVSAFKKVQHMPLFTWLSQLIEGYSRENMNIDEVAAKQMILSKQLTTISQEKTRSETERLGFTSTEHDSMQEFFNKEVKKSDAKEVLTTIQRLFKDIRNGRMKRYLVEALTKHKVLDFKYLTNVAFVICKENDTKKKLEFLFDLFAQHTDAMKRRGMRDFCEIFKLGANFFQARGQQLSLQEFLDDTLAMNIDFNVYEKTKFIMIAMMGLKPQDEEEEREAILSALNNNHNVEGYIQEHLDVEDTFYLIEKDFYEAWTMNVGFIDDKSYIIKKEKIEVIDNASLLEPMHDLRIKDDVAYGDKFILVPRFVFYPLSKWYRITKVIERKVITYKSDKKKALNLFKQRKSVTGSMIIAGSSQQVPDPFFKTIGESTFELEVYPKFFYYEKITDKGERPHQKAFINQKIDLNYVKKTLKSDKLPFQEMLVSRKQTFEEILKDISVTFKENHKRGRLWIEDQVISGAKLESTLEEYGIAIGQVIYVEYANQNNQWPTDKVSAAPQSGNKTISPHPSSGPMDSSMKQLNENLKTVGLYNLGNTCYMNSALQCLANTKFFHEYFIKEKRYMKQMNIKNKLGHQGELASNFAQLMQKMYLDGGRVVIPKEFKSTIAQISEQFAGYDQQDSQEFLFFLLDGLHEELNLRLEKPYVENPDSDDRKIIELGLEQWSNTLRRDWSFIFFLFYGQLKSTLNCQKCNKISTTFDIFTNIPLSLPEPSKILLHVVIYRLPNEIKDMLQGNKNNQMLKRIDSNKSDVLDRLPSQVERGPSNIYKIQESLKYITNDQPIHIAIRVDKDAKISQIIQEICEVKEVNIDNYQKASNLVLFSQIKGVIRGIFNNELRLSNYNLLNNEIEAIEVLNNKGRDTIREFYRQNESMVEMMKTPHLQCLMQNSQRIGDRIPSTMGSINGKKRVNNKQSKDSLPKRPKMDKCQIFNNYNRFLEGYQDYEDNDEIPDDIYVVAYHRRFLKKQYYFFNPYQPQLLSTPIIFILPTKPTGKRVYEEVWAIAQNILKKTSIYHNKQNLWWEAKNWREKVDKKEGDIQQFKPFVLKTVDRLGYNCMQCSWMKICAGCILPPTEDYIEDFAKQIHLAIEWHSSVIEDDYNPQSNEVIHHPSTLDKEIIDEDQVNLEDCLRKFHEVEEIGEKDNIYCGGCKEPQSHLKKLEIFRPPPILIVQLKRFKFNSQSRNKLNTLVEFPLYNLDVSTFVTDPEYLQNSGIDQKYDLYAMINHYGNLTYGHYISVVKNFSDGKWYKYDDSARIPIPEEQLQKDFAYILFYVRKDLQFKNLDDIMPNIKNLFPGKPVKTDNGQGFIISNEGTNMYKVQLEKGKDTLVINKEAILEEVDSNELVFDAKDIQEIQTKKKEKIIEKQRQKRKRSCLFCSTTLSFMGRDQDQNDNAKTPGQNRRMGPNGKKRTLKQSIARSSGMSQCLVF